MSYHLFFREILIKNIFLIVASIGLYPVIVRSLSPIHDNAILSTIILFVGLIIVAPLFANFAFTYERTLITNFWHRMSGHCVAFVIMLATLLLIEMIDVLFFMLVGDMFVFRLILVLLVVGILLYDFWDAYRIIFNEREF